MAHDIVPPNPAGTIEALSALGYTLEAAIADLVDNSIDADAGQVEVLFQWDGTNSYVAVVDDGRGMSEVDLLQAMALSVKGPRAVREASELGRFGMGLKTASFSHASVLTVWTRSGYRDSVRTWDLEQVVSSGEWRLLRGATPQARVVLNALEHRVPESGTIVLWQSLRNLVPGESVTEEEAHANFLAAIARVEDHLGMTFGRFVSGSAAKQARPLKLLVNGQEVQAWDPFLMSNRDTLQRPVDHLQLNGHPIKVRPFVLPPKRRLTDEQFRIAGGPKGWVGQEGFYLYRNDRLIVAGGWLGLGFRSDEKHVLARIAVDIPAASDLDWALDITKASALVPLALRGSLHRTAKATRAEAQRVLGSVSRTAVQVHSDDLSFIWKPEKGSGDLRLRINWNHPLVREALLTAADGRPIVRSLLRMIEETVPLGALRMLWDSDEDRDYEPFSSATPAEVVSIAGRIYVAYVSQGLTPEQAKTRLRHTSPFNEYPDLLSQLNLE